MKGPRGNGDDISRARNSLFAIQREPRGTFEDVERLFLKDVPMQRRGERTIGLVRHLAARYLVVRRSWRPAIDDEVAI